MPIPAEFLDQLGTLGIRCEAGVSMSKYTTLKIGGDADCMVFPQNERQIANTVFLCKRNNIDFTVIGNGSNLLVSDRGIEGVVICLGKDFSEIITEGDTITAQSGALLSKLCRTACDNGLTGLEFAFGIPGTVGGAVFMNAGAYGGEIKDVLKSVTVLEPDGTFSELSAEEAELSYRRSRFHDEPGRIIVGAKFALKAGDKTEINAKMNEISASRREKQPLDMPNAGSTFKRPDDGRAAAAMIDACGLKGRSVGGAEVSQKHAGFIVNRGGATAADVEALMEIVSTEVQKQFGVHLEPEIRRIGRK